MSTNQEKIGLSDYLYDWLGSVVFALMLVVSIFTFIGHQVEVHQTSMNPTLYEGDRVFVLSLGYTPTIGDVVVFSKQTYDDGTPLVKRIIAKEGQTVDIDPDLGTVSVDGRILVEDYIADGSTNPIHDVEFPVTVPDGCVFVLGDNRNVSKDSRMSTVGFIDEKEILGKVVAIFTPISRFRIL